MYDFLSVQTRAHQTLVHGSLMSLFSDVIVMSNPLASKIFLSVQWRRQVTKKHPVHGSPMSLFSDIVGEMMKRTSTTPKSHHTILITDTSFGKFLDP